jgi:ASC-1-like (ASCH) protein
MNDIHILLCAEPWFSKLESGLKPVEGRKGQPKYRLIKPGDKVVFCCVGQNRQFIATVSKVDSFKNLDEYLTTVTLAKALPGVETLEEGRKIYHQWSTDEEINHYGFLGIWITHVAPTGTQD